MKTRNVVIGVLLLTVLVVIFNNEDSWARSERDALSTKTAVVSVRRVFENSKKNVQWQQKMEAERQKIIADLEKISSEAKAIKADMHTRKPGSTDHLGLMRQLMEKEASLEVKEKFYQQDLSLREQQWTENLYQEIVITVGKVAEEKGLILVLAKDENQFPAASTNELLLVIKTSKVLYHAEEMDITNEVLAALDKSN